MSVGTNENVNEKIEKVQENEEVKNCENICNTGENTKEAPIDMQATQRIVILSEFLKDNNSDTETEQCNTAPENEEVIQLQENNYEDINIQNSSSENSTETVAQAENFFEAETSQNNVQETPNEQLNNQEETNTENVVETESDDEVLMKKQKQHSQDKKDYRLEKLLFDRINTMQGKIKESLELIKKFERINAKEENLPNIVTTLHDKLTQEVIKQFRTVGIEFNMKSYLVQSIVSDLLNKFEDGISEFKDCSENLNFVREVQDDFESKVELAPTSKMKNIFAKIRGLFKPERKQERIVELERERQERKLEEANIHLIKYKFINNELERYTIRKNIVDSLTREILYGPGSGLNLTVVEFIKQRISPEMTKLGLQEKILKLEDSLYEEFKEKQDGVDKIEFLNMHIGDVKKVVKTSKIGTLKAKISTMSSNNEENTENQMVV